MPDSYEPLAAASHREDGQSAGGGGGCEACEARPHGLEPQLTELSEELRAAFLQMGQVLWGSSLLMLGVAWFTSTCSAGLPVAWYAIPVAVVGFVLVKERSVIQRVRDKSTGNRYVMEALKTVDSLVYLQHPLVLKAFSATLMLDIFTDAVQIAQAKDCDALIAGQYAESWKDVPALGAAAQHVHLWYLFAAVLIMVYLLQGAFGFCVALDGQRGASSLAYEHLAIAAEWAGALTSTRLMLEIAEALAPSQDGIPTPRERRVVFSAARNVLFENAPAMFLTVAFVASQADNLTPFGTAKCLFSFALSAGGALGKAKDSFSCFGFGLGTYVGVAIVICVLGAVGKLVAVFLCDSHFVSYVTFQCVKKVGVDQ
ncbi:unnamed protein product [Prorocentrum cordatum]|uniref:Solute carrier family 40 protein n=1 Tax=Prorocentrum cordatum TaxID=2364126 RepID=A0ABN9PGA3_9DINO|nr:unnamed protein product [Polarella glacialis]